MAGFLSVTQTAATIADFGADSNTNDETTMSAYSQEIREAIRTVPNWPEPGVMFRDIMPLLQRREIFRKLIDSFVHRYQNMELNAVAAIDARGFILGAPLAYELGLSLVPVRKKGKLPFDTVTQDYNLEYGSATIELHTDAFSAGDRVLVMDDLIATGGTMLAACQLVRQLEAEVVEVSAIIDLPDLGGSNKLREAGFDVYAVCEFDGH
jgi:adenine phosphoribosyltransferase